MNEKLSIVTDEISQDLGEVRRFLDAHRLAAIELRTVGGARVPDLDARDRRTLEGWVRAGDPAVLAVSPGLFKCDLEDARETRRHLDDVLPRAIDLARALDARFLIAFTFENLRGLAPPPASIDALTGAAELSAAADLPLLLENEPGFLATTGRDLERLLAAVDHPNLFVNWDPLNSNAFRTEELADALDCILPRLRHVHVKNGRLAAGERFAKCCALGEGEIDWTKHLAALRARRYDGYLGIETHYEPVAESSAVVLSELRAMIEATRGDAS